MNSSPQSTQDGLKQRDARSYDSVADVFDGFAQRFTQPVAERLLELAELRAGHHVLDLGCGSGIVALGAARRTTATGRVLGLDLSTGMLSAAARNAEQAGVDGWLSFVLGDAEEIQLPAASFDRVLSCYALLHFPHPERALAEAARLLRPGGRLVVAIGRRPALGSLAGLRYLLRRLPLLVQRVRGRSLVAPDLLEQLIGPHLPSSGPELAHPTDGHRLGDLARALRSSGFEAVGLESLAGLGCVATPEEFWDLQATLSTRARHRLARAVPQEVTALRERFLSRCRSAQERGGQLVYPYAALIATATRGA